MENKYVVNFVEDEKDLAALVCKYLEKEGYEVRHFIDGESAMEVLDETCDLWILDIMLPGTINGYDLIKEIKEKNKVVPIIFTSARDQDIDKVMGLELGSDDYLAKPYSIRELMLRVKNVLRRVKYNDTEFAGEFVKHGPYVIDFDKRIVSIDNTHLNLTSKEYDLLLFLVKNKTKAFSRDQILDNVWGREYYGSDRVVDDLMRRLRQKMPELNVETIYGFGYRLL